MFYMPAVIVPVEKYNCLYLVTLGDQAIKSPLVEMSKGQYSVTEQVFFPYENTGKRHLYDEMMLEELRLEKTKI